MWDLPVGSVLTTAHFLSNRCFSSGGSTLLLTPSQTSGRACCTVTGMTLWGFFFPKASLETLGYQRADISVCLLLEGGSPNN